MRPYLGTFHHDSSWWSRRWGGSVWWGRWHTLSQWTSLEWLCLPGLCRLETEHTHREEKEETQWCCYSGNAQNLLALILKYVEDGSLWGVKKKVTSSTLNTDIWEQPARTYILWYLKNEQLIKTRVKEVLKRRNFTFQGQQCCCAIVTR